MKQLILLFGILLFGCCFLLWTGCNKDNLIVIEGLSTINIANCMVLPQQDFVVSDTASYNALLAQRLNTSECNSYQLPPIDFSQKTLLGKQTTLQGCSGSYTYNILANPEKRVYHYQIKAVAAGNCHDEIKNMNWITIPRLPDNYTVQFDIVD